MSNSQIESEIIRFRECAKDNLHKGLNNTIYSDKAESILSDYLEFLKIGIVFGLITLENINMYTIKEVVFNEKGNAYASWCLGTLTIQPRFFLERNREEQRNVLFHELIHSLMEGLIVINDYATNFSNFCAKIGDYLNQDEINFIFEKYKGIIELSNYYINKPSNLACEVKNFINESTTQNLAEILTAKSLGKTREKYKKFDSKIFTDDIMLQSNFATYPEYQQVFNSFLRTINGLGTIENDEELFLEYFKMLQSGSIWQQIIGTYFEKNKIPDLFEFLMTLSVLKKAKESSMGIKVVYNGDKNKLTQLVNSMFIKMNQLRNIDEPQNYPFVEFPKPESIRISFGSKR